MTIGECAEDLVNDFAIPKLGKAETTPYGLPSCSSPDLSSLCHEFKELFRSTPGTTIVRQYFIPTIGPTHAYTARHAHTIPSLQQYHTNKYHL